MKPGIEIEERYCEIAARRSGEIEKIYSFEAGVHVTIEEL